MTEQINYRELTPKDLEKLYRLIQACIKVVPYYNADAKAEELKKYNHEHIREIITKNWALGAYQEDELVGAALIEDDSGVGLLLWFVVMPELRRQGIGSGLFKFTENYLQTQGVSKLWFDTRTDNLESNGLYLKHNCRILCRLNKHWQGQDYYLWEKFLE